MPSPFSGRSATASPAATCSAWRRGSVAIVCATLICALILLLSDSRKPSVPLFGISLATLGLLFVLLARSIYLTRSAIRSAGGILETRTRELDAVFESALDSIVIFDGSGICRHANPAALRLLGVKPEHLIGRGMTTFCANPREAPIGDAPLANSSCNHGQMEMVRSTGAVLTVEYALSTGFLPDRHLVIFRDITERRKAEEARNQSLEMARSALREAHALRSATLALARELRLNPVLDTLLRTLHSLVPYDAAQIFLLEADARLFLARESHGIVQEGPENAAAETLDLSAFPVVAAALGSQNGILISDTRSLREWRDVRPGVPERSWAGVPLRAAEQVIGILTVTSTLADCILPEHLRVTESLAASAAVAIQNARLYERAEIYATELEQRLSDLRSAEQVLAKSEEDRRTSAECFSKVFRFAPIALSVTTLEDGRFLEVNQAFERRFGYTREELIGRTSTELGLWPDSAERAKLTTNLRHGKQIHSALTYFRTRSRELRCFLYSAEMIHLDGQPCILLACDHPPDDFDSRHCN
jgi:PAS domain S-box-containing protein